MALVADGIDTVVNLASIEGDVRPVILEWDGAADTAAAETLFQAWLTDYNAVAEGKVKTYYHRERYRENAFTLPTSQDAENGEYAIITTNIAGDAAKTAVINLPFPKSAAGVVYVDSSGPNRKIVDTTSTLLAAYLDNFETGGAFISDGEHSAGNIVRGRRAGA